MDKINFQKKNINIPNKFEDITNDINILLDKNEESIRAYISRYIFTSNIASDTNKKLDELFKQIRTNLF